MEIYKGPLIDYYQSSILGTGVIPRIVVSGNNLGKGFIDSPLLDPREQSVYIKNTDIEDLGKPEIEVALESECSNLPKYQGKVHSISKHYSRYFKGMSDGSKFFDSNKNLFTVFAKIASNDRIRILLRPTSVYTKLIELLRHPHYLRNNENQMEILESLNSSSYDGIHSNIVKFEINQVLSQNVPLFFSKLDSRDMFSEEHGEPIALAPEHFVVCPRETLLKHLENIEFSNSLKFAYDSFMLYAETESERRFLESQVIFQKKEASFVDQKYLLELLISRAIGNGNQVGWMDINETMYGTVQIAPKPLGLYDGMDGVCLALGYASKHLNHDNGIQLAQKSLNYNVKLALHELERPAKFIDFISPFQMPVSTLYVANKLRNLGFECPDYNKLEDLTFNFLDQNVESDEHFDILFGGAGAILILRAITTNGSSNDSFYKAKEIASKIYIHIRNNSTMDSRGVYWNAKKHSALGGFSHGTSGILFALCLLKNHFNVNVDKSFIQQILNYDLSLFDTNLSGYLDKREASPSIKYSWAHGTAGIALSRIELLRTEILEPDETIKIREELLFCLNNIKQNLKSSDSVNAGFWGQIEVCREICSFLQIEATWLSDVILKRKKRVSENILEFSYPFLNVQLGLFTGVSGLLYQNLQMESQGKIPSILTLN